MRTLSSLIERFAKSLNKDSINKENISTTILEIVSPNLKISEISMKEGVLVISASPGVNQAIKMKEDAIVETLRRRYNLRVVRVLYK